MFLVYNLQKSISSLKVNNINGQAYDTGKARTDTSLFWRSKKVKPHNAYTNIESLLEISKKLKYRTTSDKESVLNYSIKNRYHHGDSVFLRVIFALQLFQFRNSA